MATTARDIIQDAMEKLGVYAPGDTMADSDAERGLTVLNDMLDSWSNESLACFAILEQSTALTAAKQTYTIGTSGGADLNVTRPIRIQDGPGAAYVKDANGNKYPLEVVAQDVWNMIGNSDPTQVTANAPSVLFYDPQFPLGKLNFWPTENASGFTAYWDSYLQLATFANLATAVSLPPGYNLALKANLTVLLKPYFSEAQLDPMILAQAREAKATIKRANRRVNLAVYDPEIVSKGAGTYDIYSDSSAR